MDFRKNVLWPCSGELLIPRSERELRRSEGSGMLIDDPLFGEGSNASSTNKASDLSQSSGRRSVKSCHFILLTQFAYFDIVQCFVTICIVKSAI